MSMDECHRQIMAADLAKFELDTRQRPFWMRVRENWPKVLILLGLARVSLSDAWDAAQLVFVNQATFIIAIGHIMACLIAGVFATDFLTGFAHMVFDYVRLDAVPEHSRPFLQWIAYGFQYHHVVPTSWNDGDLFYLGVLRTGFTIFTPLTILQMFSSTAEVRITLCAMAFSGLFCQFPHAAAHGRWKQSRWQPILSFLQRAGLLLHPRVHHEHHSQFDRNFAIVTGWSQPILNAIYEHRFRHLVPDDMSASAQRAVYVEGRQALERPFLQMFPEYRSVIG